MHTSCSVLLTVFCSFVSVVGFEGFKVRWARGPHSPNPCLAWTFLLCLVWMFSRAKVFWVGWQERERTKKQICLLDDGKFCTCRFVILMMYLLLWISCLCYVALCFSSVAWGFDYSSFGCCFPFVLDLFWTNTQIAISYFEITPWGRHVLGQPLPYEIHRCGFFLQSHEPRTQLKANNIALARS